MPARRPVSASFPAAECVVGRRGGGYKIKIYLATTVMELGLHGPAKMGIVLPSGATCRGVALDARRPRVIEGPSRVRRPVAVVHLADVVIPLRERRYRPTTDAMGSAVSASGKPPPQLRRAADRRTWLGATALTALALACVLHGIGDESLWLDEAYSVLFARLPGPNFTRVLMAREANMSLYYLLLRGWLRLGGSDGWTRGLSGLGFVATVPVLFALARRAFGTCAAYATALLFATQPLAVAHGQEARAYGLLMLAVTVATFALLRALDTGRRRDWLLWALTLAAAAWLHFFAGLVAIAHGIALLPRIRRLPWRSVVPCALLALVLVAPLLWFVARQSGTNIAGWIPALTPSLVGELADGFAGKGGPLGLALFGLAWGAGATWIAVPARRQATLLVLAGALVPAFLVAALAPWKPLFVTRYLLVSLPAAVLLAGAGVARLPGRTLRAALLITLVAVQVPALARQSSTLVKQDWRGAVAWIGARALPGDVVSCFPTIACGPVAVYLERLPVARRPSLRTIFFDARHALPGIVVPRRRAALLTERRIWLVTLEPAIQARPDAQDAFEELGRDLAREHLPGARWSRNDVAVVEWKHPGDALDARRSLH